MPPSNRCPVCQRLLPSLPVRGRPRVACIGCVDLQHDVERVIKGLRTVLELGRPPGNVEAWWIAHVGAEVPQLFADALRRADPVDLAQARKERRQAKR